MSNLYAMCFLYLFIMINYFNILDLKDVKTRYNLHKSIIINTLNLILIAMYYISKELRIDPDIIWGLNVMTYVSILINLSIFIYIRIKSK